MSEPIIITLRPANPVRGLFEVVCWRGGKILHVVEMLNYRTMVWGQRRLNLPDPYESTSKGPPR
jgi:hypothetical protein